MADTKSDSRAGTRVMERAVSATQRATAMGQRATAMGQRATVLGVESAELMTTRARTAHQRWLTLWHAQWFRVILVVMAVWLAGAFAVLAAEWFFPSLAEAGEPDRQCGTLADALWYSIVTIATVGYGDYVPKGGVGRVLGTMLILTGTIATALLTGT